MAGRTEKSWEDFRVVSDLFEAERLRPTRSLSAGFFHHDKNKAFSSVEEKA